VTCGEVIRLHSNDDNQHIARHLSDFSQACQCGVLLLGPDGKVSASCGGCGLHCPIGSPALCSPIHLNAAVQAGRFGGRYLYFCPAGLMFAAACAAESVLCAGPMTAVEPDNYVPADLREPFHPVDAAGLREYAATLEVFSPDRITAVSNLLPALAGQLTASFREEQQARRDNHRRQQEISDYIQSIKARIMLGPQGYSPYPYDKEKQLIYAIQTGSAPQAKRCLNEILGHIFFASAENLDAIKIRAMELTVLISRAAMEAGVEADMVYRSNLENIAEFFRLDNMEDVCFALTEILRRFTEETFSFHEVKHADLLSRAVSYINDNYMHKITLEDVAEFVYISPSYLSKIFKDEMKTSFNSHLNTVRIEKSKILLLSQQLNIAEVSELVGFFDQSYFNKVFKKHTGMTPRQYREQKGGEIR